MKIVCDVLGVARSNVHVRAHRPASWTDRRRNRRRRDDGELVAEITNEIAVFAFLRLPARLDDGQSATRERGTTTRQP